MASRLFAKIQPTRKPKPEDAMIRRRTQGGRGRDTETRRDLQQTDLPGDKRYLGAGRGRQRKEQNGTRTASDDGTQLVGWREADADVVKVGGNLHRYWRRGVGEN